MKINKALFRCSSERISQVPKDDLRDIAFIGRSNVGKSSLINMLTGHGGLAKVSATPGKTRLINHFCINDAWYLVDLPGYGYARTSKQQRGAFSKLILDYVFRAAARLRLRPHLEAAARRLLEADPRLRFPRCCPVTATPAPRSSSAAPSRS